MPSIAIFKWREGKGRRKFEKTTSMNKNFETVKGILILVKPVFYSVSFLFYLQD